MRLSDEQIEELNRLMKKGRFSLPIDKREVTRHCKTYAWIQKNVRVRNAHRLTPRICELLEIEPEELTS